MPKEKRIRVQVPGTSANIGPGFDSLGIALNLYLTVTAKESLETVIHLSPALKDRLPTDETNLVYRAFSYIFEKKGETAPPLHIELDSQIPLSRGLGSSATAIVAGLLLGNEWSGSPYTKEELLQFAYEMEGHPDNVAAALYGGMTAAFVEEGRAFAVPVPVVLSLSFLAIVPETPLSTIQARSALPEHYERNDVIHTISRTALLIASLTGGDPSYLRQALTDKIHQPYRLPLIPFGEEIMAWSGKGNKGIYLSGAGPTFMALFEGRGEREAFQSLLHEEGVKWLQKVRFLSLEMDRVGARAEHLPITERV
ncbi:Homoserine kinase [[Clostridium] ultunense Esp]|nr:Homoserine kinase [[Clostridium] ultunense Esp]